jgi:hypothetical protein
MLTEFVDARIKFIQENQYLGLTRNLIHVIPPRGLSDGECPYAVVHKATKMVVCRFIDIFPASLFITQSEVVDIFGFENLSQYEPSIVRKFLRDLPMAKHIIVMGNNNIQESLVLFDEEGYFLGGHNE